MADEKRAGAPRKKSTPFEPVIEARAFLDPVDTGKLIGAEQVGVVEFQLLAVFVGDFVRIAAIGAIDGLGDRLEDVGRILGSFDERIAPIEHDLGLDAAGDAGKVRLPGPLKFVDIVEVAVEHERQIVGIPQRPEIGQTPTGPDRQAAGVGALVASNRKNIDVEGGLAAKPVGIPDVVIVDQRQNQRLQPGVVIRLQPLEDQAVGGEITALAEALDKQLAVERTQLTKPVTAHVGVVGGAVEIEAPPPGIINVEPGLA